MKNKTTTQKIASITTVLALTSLSLSSTSTAATITFDTVNTTTSLNCVAQAATEFDGTNPSAGLAKLSGTKSFTSNLATTHTITIHATGTISDLDAGERFGLDYEFDFLQTGGGIVSWSMATAIQPGGFIPDIVGPSASSGGPITLANSGNITGSESFLSPQPLVGSKAFTFDFVFTWNAGAGDTVQIHVPDNSIDLSVGVVPEPSSTALLGLGSLALLIRRRR